MSPLDPRLLVPDPETADWPREPATAPRPAAWRTPAQPDPLADPWAGPPEALDFALSDDEPDEEEVAPEAPLPPVRRIFGLSLVYFGVTIGLIVVACLFLAPQASAGVPRAISNAFDWAGQVWSSLARSLP